MITQADSDIQDRLDGVLLVGEAVAGLDADAPAAGFGGFLADGCGGDYLVGVAEDVDAVQGRTVAGNPGPKGFFLVDLLFPGQVEVNGVFYPDGVCDGDQERNDASYDFRDRFFHPDGVVKVQGVHLNGYFRNGVILSLAAINTDKAGKYKADKYQQEYDDNTGKPGIR